MELQKPKTEKKGLNFDAVFNFGTEILKLALAAGISAFVTEHVRNAVNSRRSADNVVDFPIRKAA